MTAASEEPSPPITKPPPTTTTPPPKLSKSWSPISNLSSFYSGGTILTSDTNNTHTSTPPLLFALHLGDIHILNATNGKQLVSVRNNNNTILTSQNDFENDIKDQDDIVTFCLSDAYLATAGFNNLLRLYDIRDLSSSLSTISENDNDVASPLTQTRTMGKETSLIKRMQFHPSSAYLATGCVDGGVKIWDVEHGYATHSFRSSTSSRSVSCLTWMPSNVKLMLGIGREDGSIVLEDLRIDDEDDAKKKKRHGLELKDGHFGGAVTNMIWVLGFGGRDWLFSVMVSWFIL